MRGAISRALLDGVRKLRSAERDKVLLRVGDGVSAIEAATTLEWIPITTHMSLNEALFAVVGTKRGIDVWQGVMLESFDHALLRTFVKMSTDLFGLSPASVFRQTQRLYPYLTRGVGTATFTPDASRSGGKFALHGFPSAKYDFACYAAGMEGCLEATFALCKQAGTIGLADRDDARGMVTYSVRWHARDAA